MSGAALTCRSGPGSILRIPFLKLLNHEVVESEDGREWYCAKCALCKNDEAELCQIMNCDEYRHDDKHTFFKEVKEIREE